MQDTGTTPLQSPGVLGVLTTAHFVLIAVLAVLAIAGIVYGMKLSRQRRAATRELEDAGHLERTGHAPTAEPDAPGEAVVERPAARLDEAAPGGDSAGVVQTPVERSAPVAAIPKPVVEAAPVAAVPEPVVESAPPAPAVADTPIATPAPVAIPPPETDLTRLRGLGPKVAAMLVDQGIPDIAALARLDAAQADAVAAGLGTFAPRMVRDRWVEQAQLLAAGDIAGFEATFGKL